MAKQFKGILLFGLLALGILLFGCSQPQGGAQAGGEAAQVQAIIEAAEEENVKLNACELLTLQEVSSTCGSTSVKATPIDSSRGLYGCYFTLEDKRARGAARSVLDLTYSVRNTVLAKTAREQLKKWFEDKYHVYAVDSITNAIEISNLGDYAFTYNLGRDDSSEPRSLLVAKGNKILQMWASTINCDGEEKLKALAQTALTRVR